MKPINRRLLITGVAIGIFICTLVVGVVQVNFFINKALTEREEEPFRFYKVFIQQKKGIGNMNMKIVNSIKWLFRNDMEVTFEYMPSRLDNIKCNDEALQSRIMVTDENYPDAANLKILKGRYFSIKDNKDNAKVCVIHESLYNLLGKRDSITLDINGEDFKVIGVISGELPEVSYVTTTVLSVDELIFMPINTYFKYFEEYELENVYCINDIIIKAPKSYAKEYFENRISKYSLEEFQIPGSLTVKEAGEDDKKQLINTLGIVRNALIIASLVLFLAGLNIVQITTANLYDIRKEIGLKMALGARKIDIMKEVAFEVISCTLKGGYIGVGLYAVLFFVVNKYIRGYGALKEVLNPMLKQYTEYFRLTFNVETFLIGISLSIILGFISSIIPVIRSVSVDPIRVLRKE